MEDEVQHELFEAGFVDDDHIIVYYDDYGFGLFDKWYGVIHAKKRSGKWQWILIGFGRAWPLTKERI